MAKQIFFDEEGRRQLERGVGKLARAVRLTLGPTGRSVMLEKKFGSSTVTNDGIVISRELELPQPFENMGVKLLHEVANRTNKDVGDGTATAMILAQAIVSEGEKYILAGASPIALRNGIDLAVRKAVAELAKLARPVEGKKAIQQVAFIASNQDNDLGKIVADALTKAGTKGVVTVEENDGVDTVLEMVDGLSFDKGYVSPYFITHPEELVARLENPYVLITDHKISNIHDLIPVMESLVTKRKPLVIVAEDVEGEALAGLIINRLRGVLEVVAVKAPGFGDRRKAMLEDLAVLTGGTFLSKDLGFDWTSVTLDQLGSCKKFEASKDKTYFFRGQGKKEDVAKRAKQISAQIKQTTSSYDREKLEERLGKLTGGIAVIKVGAHTETVLKEKKERAQHALNATRAAVEEGIVPGGGTAYVRCVPAVRRVKATGDVSLGVKVVARALEAPLMQLGENVGQDGPAIVAEVEEASDSEGFDAVRGKMTDLFSAGIVDPVKVMRVALQNAASIASLSLVSETVIAELSKGESKIEGAVS